MLAVHLVTSRQELSLLRDEWAALLQASNINELSLSPDWLLCWWDVFGEAESSVLRVCTLRQHGQLIGLVPMRARRHLYRQALPFRRLELLASGEREEDEIASDYLGMIAAPGKEKLVADEFARQLTTGRLGAWDELICTRLSAVSPTTTALIDALRNHGAEVLLSSQGKCHYVQLPSTWDEYLKALPSRRRYTVKRSLRELEKFSGGKYELRMVKELSELERGFEILTALHDERWAARDRQGVFHSRRFNEFHQTIMRQLLEANALRLYWLEVDGQPYAAVYNIIWNNKIYFYQSGRKMDVPSKLKPGIALHALAIREAIGEGLTEYDFLGGDAQYKAQLSTDNRELIELRVVPPRSLREPVRQLTEVGISAMQSFRQRVRDWRARA